MVLMSFSFIGSWVIGVEPAGIGNRKNTTENTAGLTCFVPNVF